jgi:hypothetical protein
MGLRQERGGFARVCTGRAASDLARAGFLRTIFDLA